MVKISDRKSLKGRRFNVLIHGNQSSDIIQLRSVLRTVGLSSCNTRVMYRLRLLHTMSPVCHLRWDNSSRRAYYSLRSRRQPVHSSKSSRRLVGSSQTLIQGRPKVNDTKPLVNVTESNSMARPSCIPQIAGCSHSKQHFKEEKDTKPLAHQLSCSNNIASMGLAHIFHTEQQPSDRVTISLIMHALIQTIMCFMFYFWLVNFRS